MLPIWSRTASFLGVASILCVESLFAANQAVTFNKDIAPILFARCASCHRPGGGAPFNLLTYEDARQRASLIAQVTRRRYMPPWKPEPGFGEFAGERRLTAAEVALFERWVESGVLQGEQVDLPVVPQWPAGNWQLGAPDLVITMPEAYRLAADSRDVFRTFVVPIPNGQTRYVRAVEFRPGSLGAVHHANIKIDRTRSSRRHDEDEPGPGYDGGGGRSAVFPDGQFLGWTPGQLPYTLADDMAWRLESNSDLVLELHMMPTGRPEAVQASVGLYFTERVPTRVPLILRLGRQSLDIPAGEKRYEMTDAFVLPVDVEVLGVQAHAHDLAREMKATAQLPDGTTKWLLYIKDWDFTWQDVYRYREPLRLPAGTMLSIRYTYDNSADNIRNPNTPPKRVTFGQTTASEMGNLWIQVVARNREDRAILERLEAPALLREDIAGYEKAIEITPRDARLHADLGLLYLAAGREADALVRLNEALRLAPDAWQHYALGTLLLGQKKLEEAIGQFTEAVRLKPDFPEAFNNLGVAKHAQGRIDEAIVHYQEALRLEEDYAQAHYNLGRARAAQGALATAINEYTLALRATPDDPEILSSLGSALASAGRIGEAVVRYRRALEINPALPAAMLDLSWILATSDRPGIHAPEEAVRLALAVADLTHHQNPTVLETLAIAYFSAGRAPEATAAARTAILLASESGAKDLARDIRRRLELFGLRVQ